MSETFDEETRKALTDYRMEQADSAEAGTFRYHEVGEKIYSCYKSNILG